MGNSLHQTQFIEDCKSRFLNRHEKLLALFSAQLLQLAIASAFAHYITECQLTTFAVL